MTNDELNIGRECLIIGHSFLPLLFFQRPDVSGRGTCRVVILDLQIPLQVSHTLEGQGPRRPIDVVHGHYFLPRIDHRDLLPAIAAVVAQGQKLGRGGNAILGRPFKRRLPGRLSIGQADEQGTASTTTDEHAANPSAHDCLLTNMPAEKQAAIPF
jgi:hypothetical protein